MLDVHSPQPAMLLPLAIRRYFEVALYLLVLTGFGTLASTGGLDLVTAGLVGAAILFRGYCLATRRTVLIAEKWTTLLTIAYVAFYLADYFLLSRAFLNATIHLVLFQEALEIIHGLLAPKPIARAAAEINPHLLHGLTAE